MTTKEKALVTHLIRKGFSWSLAWSHNIDPRDLLIFGVTEDRAAALALVALSHMTGTALIPNLQDIVQGSL